MKREFLKSFLLLMILVSIQLGCDRAKMSDNGTTIVIKTPSLPPGLMSRKSEVSSLATSSIVPTGFDGTAPINCYALMIAGPEPLLRRNQCGVSGYDVSQIPVGMWVGGIPAGGTLSMPGIPAGEDRVVRLIGFHAKEGACIDFKKNEMPKTLLSDPYIIAEAGRVKMPPGSTVTLEMDAVFDANKKLNDCSGPDFSDGGGSNNPNPALSNFMAMKFDFPKNSFVRGQCARIDLRLMSNYGNFGALPSDVTFKLSQIYKDLNNIPNQPIYEFYPSLADCLATTPTPITNMIFKANTDRAEAYVKISNSTTFKKLSVVPEIISSPISLSPKSNINDFGVYEGSQSTFEINGPERILPGLCYLFTVRGVNFNGTVSNSTSITLNGSSGLNIFSSPTSCSTGSSSPTVTLTVAAGSLNNFYVKMDATATLPYIQAVDGGAVPDAIPAVNQLIIGSGTTAPHRIELMGNNQIARYSCGWGSSVQMRVLNDQGVPVPSNGLSCTLINPNSSTFPFEIYTDPQCSSNTLRTLGTAFILPIGTTFSQFFIKTTTSVVGPGQIDLDCQSLTQPKSSFFFQIL